MTIDTLFRGQAYHFTFVDNEFDALLVDVDYSSSRVPEILEFFCIDENKNISAKASTASAADFVMADLLHLENAPSITAEIDRVITELESIYANSNGNMLYEDDAIDGIEKREDISCISFYLCMFTELKREKGLFYILNSMPYLLKRKPNNRLAYKILLYGIIKSAFLEEKSMVQIPVFPDQHDLYATSNVTMLRKLAYQLIYCYNNILMDRFDGAKRFTGYIHSYQIFNSRGLVLFANERNLIPFSVSNIMDARLSQLLQNGLSETGRIEIEFSLGYIPKEGGAQVSSFVCTRMCLTEVGVQCCIALGKEISDELCCYDGYKEVPICPTSYYPADSYLGISRIFHEGQLAEDDSKKNKGLFYPIGTQIGYIINWAPKKNNNGVEIWEGELGCNGNIIHFNLFQIYEKSLQKFLISSPEQVIGTKVKFEPAFNASKNRIAIWADVIRTVECDLDIPPEYDRETLWSVARSQQMWIPPEGVADTYKVLQPWLPIFNPLLENCHIGKLDLQHLSSSQSFLGGRIISSAAQNAIWYNFQISSVHERYLMNILMSALCYNVCGSQANTGIEINVIYNLQPSSIPGRDMADNIILLPLSRSTIWNSCNRKLACPVNRSGNILLELTDHYLPLQVKGKPIHVQKNYVKEYASPDIFCQEIEYTGQITKVLANGMGIIVDSTNGAEILFRSEQVYEEGLQERIQKSFAKNRYAGMLVKFQKKQALQEKAVSAIRADYIYSRDLDKKDVIVSTDYKPLSEPEAPVKTVVENFRKGILVDYRDTVDGIVCNLCDENLTLWPNENDEQVICSHLKFNIERISDGRLRHAIETRRIHTQIPVLFNLVKLDCRNNDDGFLIGPDCVHLSDDTAQEYGLVESQEYPFVPLGPAITANEIQEAKRYVGKVTANDSSTRIWIEIEENNEQLCYVVNGNVRSINRINTSCTSSDRRQYILEPALRDKLQNGLLGMEVCFIPIKPVNDSHPYPQAGYLTFTSDERIRQNISKIRYYPSFAPQIYMPSSDADQVSMLHQSAQRSTTNNINAVTETEQTQISVAFDLDSLMYSRSENNFDKLIKGEVAHINGDYKEAATLFVAGKRSQGNTIMQQKGLMPDGHFEGLRLVTSREKRIAYADALIRNRDLVFENPVKLLNTIADLFCSKKEIIDWGCNFDRAAYRVIQQYKKALQYYGIHAQMIARVDNVIMQMESARQEGSRDIINNMPNDSHRDSSSATQLNVVSHNILHSDILPILREVPFLNHALRQSSNNRNPASLPQKSVLEEIMKKAEDLLRTAKIYQEVVSTNRLYGAAFYYGIVLRDQWEDCPEGCYEFARRAMSFALLPYSKFEMAKNAVRGNVTLWTTVNLPDDVQMFPQANGSERQLLRYLHFILQTACLSKQINTFFTPYESQMILSHEKSETDNKWFHILHKLCSNMNITLTETTDINAILQAYRNWMVAFEQSLPRVQDSTRSIREHIHSFKLLGNRHQENSPIYRCAQVAAKFEWVKDKRVDSRSDFSGKAGNIFDAFLHSLEKLALGASSEKTSIQINSFAEVLGNLTDLKSWIIQEPNLLSVEYILPCIDSYINCLTSILHQLCLSRHYLKMDAQMGSINEVDKVITVPISISSSLENCSCSGVRISADRNGTNVLKAIENNNVIPPLESGDTVVVEMRFKINESIKSFRERQSISVVLRLDYDTNRFKNGKLIRHPEYVEKMLDCPIQQAQYEIDPDAFNSKATQYDETHYFVGRSKQIAKMKDALYDSSKKLFRHGVGVIIYGQRRSGKSWLAGKLCSELKKIESNQAPIICDKIDISQLSTSTDIMTEIINRIVAAIPQSDRDIADFAFEYAKPFSMLDTLEKTLQLHRRKNEELDFDELQNHIDAVREGFRKLSATDHASFPAFYYELERQYTERHGEPLPPITIVLDEFTGIYDRIMAGNMTLQEVLSVVKLIESYRINVILICADHYKSVLTAIDENAFTHYKTQIEVTGLEQPEAIKMICRPLAAKRIDGASDEHESIEPRIDENGAIHLHLLYNGNVYLLAKACDAVVNHMNYHGYLHMSSGQLNSFENELLVSTMTEESMQAYVVDGRFLERQIASFVLKRLNIVAISTVAQSGTQGTAFYSDVLNSVKKEYQKLFMQEDMSHFIDLLNANGQEGKMNDREMVIEREYAMERISAENVLDWLEQRKVLYRGGSTNREVTLSLKLQAYIKAREIPNCECYRMEEMSSHSQNSAEIPALDLTEVDLTVFDEDE